MFKILVCDRVSPKGVAVFNESADFEVSTLDRTYSEDEMVEIVSDVAAILVRSATKITSRIIEAAPHLKVIGRAGVGVDNVDIPAATKRGVIVMNAPGGNTISTSELTFSMLLALARNIPQAHMSMKSGAWERKSFVGVEVYGKTLGVLGLGRIGSEVAKRAQAFGMRVLGYDPYVTTDRAAAMGIELVDELDALYPQCDYITVHMPKTEETKGMLNSQVFDRVKPGVRILNCARGGIVDETALHQAIVDGKVAGAALDVYETEPPADDLPLRSLPQVIMTPHLGASTEEAQENVGIEVAHTVSDYLRTGQVANAVNLPNLDAKTYELTRPFLELGERLGRLVSQLAPKRNERLVITYGGKAREVPGDPITRAILKGFLASAEGEEVNNINARQIARSMGITIEEIKSSEETDYTEWLHVAAHSGDTKTSAGGTVLGTRAEPRIVRVHGRPVEIVPEGSIMFFCNADRPGFVGDVGQALGKAGVNIASMTLSRKSLGQDALTVLNLDSTPDENAIEAIQGIPGISHVQIVRL